MQLIYEYRLSVPSTAIDVNGHANNVEYVRWMQDAAVAHSDAQGWNMARYRALGGVWIVRSHTIEYLLPAVSGDRIVVQTWVADRRRVRSRRRYRFVRDTDRALLARALTLWVFVDMATGRPRPLTKELEAAFPVVPDSDLPWADSE